MSFNADTASVIAFATKKGTIHSRDLRCASKSFAINLRPEMGYLLYIKSLGDLVLIACLDLVRVRCAWRAGCEGARKGRLERPQPKHRQKTARSLLPSLDRIEWGYFKTFEPTVVEEKIGVPNGVVGYIIGAVRRGGESIVNMQRRSNCKVQIQKEYEMEPCITQRVITLTVDSREAIDAARGIIEEAMVREKMAENGGGSGGGRVGGPGFGAGGVVGGRWQGWIRRLSEIQSSNCLWLPMRPVVQSSFYECMSFLPCIPFL